MARRACPSSKLIWMNSSRTRSSKITPAKGHLAYRPEVGGLITEWNPPQPYVTNFKVMQEEMAQRDVMTANRDKRIWAGAKGGDLEVNDSNLPPVSKVKSNFVGPNPDQSFQ